MKRIVVAIAICLAGAPASSARELQREGQRPAAPPETAGVTPAEVQRMFDSYALMQAQEQLRLREDQFPPFLTQFKTLQDVRRSAQQQRLRQIVELRRLLNAPQSNEPELREHIKTLDEIDARLQADLKKAYDAIDALLDVRQQARFRVFEELMERRKLELVNRARQANRSRR